LLDTVTKDAPPSSLLSPVKNNPVAHSSSDIISIAVLSNSQRLDHQRVSRWNNSSPSPMCLVVVRTRFTAVAELAMRPSWIHHVVGTLAELSRLGAFRVIKENPTSLRDPLRMAIEGRHYSVTIES
jgi:hypothetical protein